MAGRGKRYRDAKAQISSERTYSPGEAIELVKGAATAKFTESVELHIRTGLDVKHADQQLRGTVALPHGAGKDVTVAVFAKGDKANEAKEAGADIVGDDDLAKKIEEGFDDFDTVIATPDMMPTVAKLGRVLGPSGKMPNPKVGTVTPDVKQAVEESKAGKTEYRTDRNAIVHMTIGKADFESSALLDNLRTTVDEVVRAKPAAAKGRYIQSVTVASTMGPGIKVDHMKLKDSDEEVSAA